MITLDPRYVDTTTDTYRHYSYMLQRVTFVGADMAPSTKARRTLGRTINHHKPVDTYGSRAVTFAAFLGLMEIDKTNRNQWLDDLQQTMTWLYLNQQDAIHKYHASDDKAHAIKMHQLSDYETILREKMTPATPEPVLKG